MADKLSLLEESSDSEGEFKINKAYADRYNVWRNKEELQKYKDLKKEEDDSESSSESDEEIPEFEEDFFRALSLLKGKDPRLYDKDFVLFKNKEVEKKTKTVKQKPMYMKEYERKLVLERGGKFSDEEDEEHIPAKGPTYDEEQEELKKSFKAALADSDADDDADDDDLLQVRTKTENEKDEEESDYLKWLKGEAKEISEDAKKDMSYLRNYWNDPKLDEGEKFLKDYILNKRYLEKDDNVVPTYEEITSGALSDDEKMIEEQEKFEHKYNFRFEEPDQEFIKRYPRTVGDSLRKKDSRRKQKREEKAERRKREKEQRQEELKRLKALKRKEIEEKFMKLKDIVGEKDLNLNESDIESDFDPDKHDQKMGEMFNDDYYQVEEQQKPDFPYDEELDSENWNTWIRDKSAVKDDNEKESIAEVVVHDNEEGNEHAATNASLKEETEKEMINATLPRKKFKKKSLFSKVISQPKPIYDPDGKSFDEYLDEYYKLDYEDVVGDLPVRYKYRKVIPNDFGLTIDEILMADERELNRWCSVKKTCQYRNDDEELYDVQAYQRKAQNLLTKKKVLSSVYAPKEIDDTDNFSSNTEKKNDMPGITNKVPGEKDYSEVDKNKSNIDSNAEQRLNEDSCVSQSLKKKSKKRKKSKQNSLCIESESKNSEVKNEQKYADNESGKGKSLFESSNSQENNNFISKSSKRKKVDYENTFENSSAESSYEEKQTIDNSVQCASDNRNSNMASNNSNENNAIKKKKKKRKKKKKNDSTQIAISGSTTHENEKRNTSNVCSSKFSKNNMKQVPQDKRLGLSDERLAAYGINSKKFKNKIIYSKR